MIRRVLFFLPWLVACSSNPGGQGAGGESNPSSSSSDSSGGNG